MSYKPDIYTRTYNKFTSPEGFTYYHIKWPMGKLPMRPGASSLIKFGTSDGNGSTQFEANAVGSFIRNSYILRTDYERIRFSGKRGDSASNLYVGRSMLSSESTGYKRYGKSICALRSSLSFHLCIGEDEWKKAAEDYVIHYWIDIFNGAYEKPPDRQVLPDKNGRELFSLDMLTCYFDGVKSQFEEDPSSFSDIVLVTKRADDGVERRFYCHRMILAARSPVFKTMLTNQGFEESRKRLVDIEDVSSECMENVLEYIYTGVCAFGVTDRSMPSFMDRVFEVLYTAQKYALPELVDMCAKYAVSFDSDSERLDVLRVAELHDPAWLKRLCIMALSTNMTIFDKEECRGKISDEGLAELGKMCAERVLKTKAIQVCSKV